jgi:ribosomal protein S8
MIKSKSKKLLESKIAAGKFRNIDIDLERKKKEALIRKYTEISNKKERVDLGHQNLPERNNLQSHSDALKAMENASRKRSQRSSKALLENTTTSKNLKNQNRLLNKS